MLMSESGLLCMLPGWSLCVCVCCRNRQAGSTMFLSFDSCGSLVVALYLCILAVLHCWPGVSFVWPPLFIFRAVHLLGSGLIS